MSRAERMWRPWVPAVLAVVLMVAVAGAVVAVKLAGAGNAATVTAFGPTTSWSSPTPTPAPPGPTAQAPRLLRPNGGNPVTGPSTWWSWALIDRRTGDTWGGPTADEPTRSVSMIKFWLGGLYLRAHPDPSRDMLAKLSTMIRDSNNDVANEVFFGLGGRIPVVEAMTSVCGVTGPYILPGWWWASTWISSRDVARLGLCLAEGRVANPQWTDWLLGEMRQVRGYGDFGIRWAFPDDVRPTIAIKNGWNVEDGIWYVNCLAIGDTWVLATESRAGSFITGRDVCVDVTRQLLAEPDGPLDIWSVPEKAAP